MFCKQRIYILVITSLISTAVSGYDLIVEFKAAYFLPTNHVFKSIYHGGAIYGPEVTFELHGPLYGFAAIDFFNKKGNSLGLCNPTKVNVINLEAGLKYFIPIEISWLCFDSSVYVGLGILPTRLHTHDYSSFVITNQTKWGCGGIAKIGAYIAVLEHCIFDLFFNYSFAKINFNGCSNQLTQSHNAHTNGCWFGAGLAYQFN